MDTRAIACQLWLVADRLKYVEDINGLTSHIPVLTPLADKLPLTMGPVLSHTQTGCIDEQPGAEVVEEVERRRFGPTQR